MPTFEPPPRSSLAMSPRRPRTGSAAAFALAILLLLTPTACRRELTRNDESNGGERSTIQPGAGMEAEPQAAAELPSSAANTTVAERFALPSARLGDAGPERARLELDPRAAPIQAQQGQILHILQAQGFEATSLRRIEQIMRASGRISYGNPKTSRSPMASEDCRRQRSTNPTVAGDPRCGAPNMVPIHEAGSGQSAANASVCIDQFEFPNEPCAYPVVWARANEAAAICQALGKRLCDAHEWEGACAARPLAPALDYGFEQLPEGLKRATPREKRLFFEHYHNQSRDQVWAYGDEKRHQLCATSTLKGAACTDADFETCGSNTFPAGAFPKCKSALGVYDQHGNVAEHMSLPMTPSELGGRGWTEMKGSWFIFADSEPHPDDCRWRARNWHGSRVDDPSSHRSYHLGFRCCKDL